MTSPATTSPTAALRHTARSAVSRAAERGEPEGIPASASTMGASDAYLPNGRSEPKPMALARRKYRSGHKPMTVGQTVLEARSEGMWAGILLREASGHHGCCCQTPPLAPLPPTTRHAAEGTVLRSPGAAGLPRPRRASRLLRSGSDPSFAQVTGLLYSVLVSCKKFCIDQGPQRLSTCL